MASFIYSSSKERVEMASVSRHGKVKAVLVDLDEEYRPDEEPLLSEVPINDFMRNQRPTKKRSPMHRPTILHQAEQRKAHVIDSEPAPPHTWSLPVPMIVRNLRPPHTWSLPVPMIVRNLRPSHTWSLPKSLRASKLRYVN